MNLGYRYIEKYGVVVQKLKGGMYVGDNPPENFKTRKELDNAIKGKPELKGRLHECIETEENLRQYARDNGINVPDKVPKEALKKIREAIDKELKKREDEPAS